MKKFILNYYTISTTIFRISILIETIYLLFSGEIFSGIYGILTFIITFLINFIYKITKLTPSLILKFSAQLFIFLSMFLGHLNNFYDYISNWDDILHILSGFILALFGYLTLEKFDNDKSIILNKPFIAFYIIIFGIASAGLWEIFEFTTDNLFSLQSQESLRDTMFDIINGTIGPLIMSIIYIKKSLLFENK